MPDPIVYTPIPLALEARQHDGTRSRDLQDWLGDYFIHYQDDGPGDEVSVLFIASGEDSATAVLGEWIVKDVLGGFAVMSDQQFRATYAPSGATPEPISTHESDDRVSVSSGLVNQLTTLFFDPQQRAYATEHALDQVCPYPHGPTDDDGTFICPVLASYVRNDAVSAQLSDRTEADTREIKAREALFDRELAQAKAAAHERAVREGRLR